MTTLLPALLTASLLTAEPSRSVIPDGHAAYAVKVDRNTNPFLKPGDRVDVIMTERVEERKLRSTVVARDLLLLAIEIATDEKAPLTVTVAVKPDDAKALEAMRKRGELRLLLRDPAATAPPEMK
jgi:Flp pilus assembly protein CpaB